MEPWENVYSAPQPAVVAAAPAMPNLGGLANAFDAQKQTAAQSQLLTDEQFKQINSLIDPSDNLAAAKYAQALQGNAPQLKFDTNATGIGTGIMQGLGNAVNNTLAIRNYKQQKELGQQAYGAYQADRQRQIELANQQVQAQALQRQTQVEWVKKNRPDLLGLFEIGTPEQRGAIITKEIGAEYKPIEAKAESDSKIAADQAKLNWQRERFHALTGKYPEQIFAEGNQGALTPQVQSAWKYVYDADAPKDALDFKQRFAQVGAAVEGYRGAKIDNETRGERNQAGLDSTLLSNSVQQVNLKYADALKQADKLLAEGKVEEAQKLKTNLQEGRARYDQAVQKYDQMTDGQVALFNSQMDAIGLPYKLPPKGKLSAVTKDGKVTQFYDPYTGKVTTPQGN